MKILHVFDHSIPVQDGYAQRSLAILTEQRLRGWETAHLTGPKQPAAQSATEVGDLRFHRTAPLGGWMARLPGLGAHLDVVRSLRARLLEVAQAERPDVLHAHSPSLNGLAALSVSKELGIPLVYEVRAFWEDAAVDQGSTREGDLRYRLTAASETWVFRRADAVTCICNGLRNDIVGRGIAADKVTVIPNAVAVDNYAFRPPRDVALAEQLGLGGGPVFGFIGSFYAYEGLDLLIQAFAQMAPDLPGARLLLVGGGMEDAALRQQAQASGVGERIVFTGRVAHADVERYYSLLDLAVFPRHSMRLTETVTPLKPLEAMAMGVVSLASNVGGHHELIDHGETGLLFKAGDAQGLAQALKDWGTRGAELDTIRAKGRHFVENERNWRTSVARYAPIYERLVQSPR